MMILQYVYMYKESSPDYCLFEAFIMCPLKLHVLTYLTR